MNPMNDEAISFSTLKRYEAAFNALNAEIASRDVQIVMLTELLLEAKADIQVLLNELALKR